MLGECCPSDNDSSFKLLVLDVVPGAVLLSQVDVAFNVLDLSVVAIYWTLSSTYSSSDDGVHFHQLIPVAFVVDSMVYYRTLCRRSEDD